MNLIFKALAACALMGGIIVGPSGSLFAADVKSLSGYKAYSTLSSFKVFLEDNPDVYEKLKNDQALAEEVLGNTARQREMMQGAVAQAPESVAIQAEKPADTLTRDEQATQAANEAIIRALAEKEAANKRAQETLELITQQGALINQARAEAELAATEAKMENIRAAFDGHPEKAAEFFANTALLQKVMDDQLSLEEALAEAGITLEETSEPDTPGPEYIEYPEDQLVHVYGNKYRLGDKEIYDLNHVPSEEEMALDENGWPKFLNVPAECGPADPDVTYFFESRYGLGQNRGIVAGGAMNFLNPRGFPQGNRVDVGLTDSEQFAVPFFTPNNVSHPSWADFRPVYLPDLHSRLNGGAFNISISHCPGDWERKNPEGRPELSKKCSYTYGEFVTAANEIYVKVKNEGQRFYGGNHDRVCALEPGKRYFFNMSPPHHVDPSWPTQRERMLSIYKRLNDRYPERYPLSPEEQLANWKGPMRNGEIVKTWGTDILHISRNMRLLPPMPKAVGGLVGNPHKSSHGNYYAVSTKTRPRQSTITHTHSRCDGNDGMVLRDVTCYDPKDILSPVRMVYKCTGARTAAWVEGYNAKLFNIYVCPSSNHEHHRPCLADKEGDFRQVEYKNPKPAYRSRIRSTHTIEQCQFLKQRGRFGWIAVEAETAEKDLGGHRNHNRRVVSPFPGMESRDYCLINGKTINIGDNVSLSCGNKDIELTCKQTAAAPALPALVDKSGVGLNSLPFLRSLPSCQMN